MGMPPVLTSPNGQGPGSLPPAPGSFDIPPPPGGAPQVQAAPMQQDRQPAAAPEADPDALAQQLIDQHRQEESAAQALIDAHLEQASAGQTVYDAPVGPPRPVTKPSVAATATHMPVAVPQLVENVDGSLAIVDQGKIRPLTEEEKHAAHLMAQAIRIGGPVMGGAIGSLAGPLGSGAGSVAGGEVANPIAQGYDRMAGEKPHERTGKERVVEGVLGALAPFGGKFLNPAGVAGDAAVQAGGKAVTGGAESAAVNTVAELEAKGAQAMQSEKAAGDQSLKDANLPVVKPGAKVTPNFKKGVEQQTLDALESAKKNQAKAPEVAEAVKALDQEHQHHIGTRTRVAIRREQGQLHPVSDELAADYEKYMGTPASEAGAAQAGEPSGDTVYPKRQVQQGAEASAKNPGKPGSRANIPDQTFDSKHVQQGFEVGAKGRVPVKGATEPQVQIQEGLPGIAGRTKYRTGSSEQLPENLGTRGQVSSREQASPTKQVQQSAPLVVGKQAPSPGSVGQFESAAPSSEVQPSLPLEGGGAPSKRLSLQQIEALRNKIKNSRYSPETGAPKPLTPEAKAELDGAYARSVEARDALIKQNFEKGVGYPGKRQYPPLADSEAATALRAKRDELRKLRLANLQGINKTLEQPGATMLDVARKHPFENVSKVLTPEQLTSVGDSLISELQDGVKGSPSKTLQKLMSERDVVKPYLGDQWDNVVTFLKGAAEVEKRGSVTEGGALSAEAMGALKKLSKMSFAKKLLTGLGLASGIGVGYKARGAEPSRSPQSDGTQTFSSVARGTVGGKPVEVPVTIQKNPALGKDTRDSNDKEVESMMLKSHMRGDYMEPAELLMLRDYYNYRLRHGLPVNMYNKRLLQKMKGVR